MEPRGDLRSRPAAARRGGPRTPSAVHRACQDPDIQRWTTVPPPYLREHAVAFVTEHCAGGLGGPAPARRSRSSTRPPARPARLLRPDHASTGGSTSAEVGYWTAPWARGRGVAVRATRAVARWAFDDLGLGRHRLAGRGRQPRLPAGRAARRLPDRGVAAAAARPPARTVGRLGRLVLPGEIAGPGPATHRPPRRRSARRDRGLSVRRGGGPDPGRRRIAGGAAGGGAHGGAARAARRRRGPPIRLRRPSAPTSTAIVAACRDPESVRWTTVPDPYAARGRRVLRRRARAGRWARGTGAVFAIADADDRYCRLDGAADLRRPTRLVARRRLPRRAVGARARVRLGGAARTVPSGRFDALGLSRIEWRADVGNDASRRVGREGRLHDRGHRARRDRCTAAGGGRLDRRPARRRHRRSGDGADRPAKAAAVDLATSPGQIIETPSRAAAAVPGVRRR